MSELFTAADCRGPVSAAAQIRSTSVEHKSLFHTHLWADYNTQASTYAWTTSYYRFIGIKDRAPNVELEEGELLIPVALPWKGHGKDLRDLVAQHVRRHNRSLGTLRKKARRAKKKAPARATVGKRLELTFSW